MKMVRHIRFLFLTFFLLCFVNVFATHNRAGYISYRYIGVYNPPTVITDLYEVTIHTFTKLASLQADRPSLDSVYWGDGLLASFPRVSYFDNPVYDLRTNLYVNTHLYNEGNDTIHVEDPNRNEGVINIPNSVEVPFYLSTVLVINHYRGPDNSPIVTNPPIYRGCKGRPFYYNPAAFDPDGDSLSYELTACRGAGGQPIPGFTLPMATHSFTLNAVTGDMVWDSPDSVGEYNVAFLIKEWRNGQPYGYVTVDMQITILECNNNPPFVQTIADTCVLAGDSVTFDVTGIDPDGNNLTLDAFGGPMIVTDPATFTSLTTGNDTVTSRFTWHSKCHHVRRQPYVVQFKAQDSPPLPDSVSLVSFGGTSIRVIGPPPQNLTATAVGSSIQLHWDPSACSEVVGYHICRREGLYGSPIPCPCDNGAPSYTGYTLLGYTRGYSNTNFTDDNHGAGLNIGIQYCYLITAVFPDSSESCASPQTCATLKKDLPVLTNADVMTTDQSTGSVYVAWSYPTDLDTVLFPPPYEYRLFHSPDFFFSDSTIQIATFPSLTDTTFIDTGIDTKTHPWSYRVDMYYTNAGTLTRKGSAAIGSTVFLSTNPSDNRITLTWEEHVPWLNDHYDIFRFNPATSLFDSIATTTQHFYLDSGLGNGTTYCYYVRSSGSYAYS